MVGSLEPKSQVNQEFKNNSLHIYCRVSSQVQVEEGNSIVVQEKTGIRKFKELEKTGEVKDYQIWNEGGQSSDKDTLDNRPVLEKLLMGVELGIVNHIFVFDIDRLSRNRITFTFIRSKLIENDVNLYLKDQKYNLNREEDNLVMGIVSEVVTFENKKRGEKSRIGKLHRIRDGHWKGGQISFGYRVEDKKPVIDEFESGWVKRCYKWFVEENKPTIWIKEQLDINGIETRRGGLWNLGSIRNMLSSTFYIGYYDFTDKKSGQTIRVKVPPLIDKDLWKKSVGILKKTSRKNQRNGNNIHEYLLRGLLECECGNLIKGMKKNSGNQVEGRYFCDSKMKIWRDRDQKHYCKNNKSLNLRKTESFIWKLLLTVVSRSTSLKEEYKNQLVESIQNQRKESSENDKKYRKKINQFEREKERLENLLINLTVEGVDETVSSDVNKIKDKLKSKKEELEKKIEEEVGNFNSIVIEKKWVNWIKKFDEELMNKDNLPFKKKREYLEQLIDKIIVSFNPDNMTHNLQIHFKVPIIGDIREKVGKEFIIKDGKKVLDTVDLGLHGRMFQSEEQKKTIDDWVVRNLPTKGKHSVTVE